MNIFQSSDKRMKESAGAAATIAFGAALLASLAWPMLTAMVTDAPASAWGAALPKGLGVAAAVAAYVFVLLRLPGQMQQVMAWLSLAGLIALPAIRAKWLERILPDAKLRVMAISVVWPAVQPMPEKLRILVDYLAAELSGGALWSREASRDSAPSG